MMNMFYNLFYRANNDQQQLISQKWQHSWTLAKVLNASLLFMSSVKQRETRTGSTGCEYMECIIVNWVSPLSSTFNPVAVSFPPAKTCLFKWRPARRPQPWRSAVSLHLIPRKWADWENFLLLFPLQDESVFCLNSYPSGGVVRLDVPVKLNGSYEPQNRSLVSGSLQVPEDKQNVTQAEFSKYTVSPLGCNWIVLGLLQVSTRSSSNSRSCGQRDLFREEM